MIVWIDAQVPRSAAAWLTEHCGVEARTLRDVGLSGSDDLAIFTAAKAAGVVLLSKDEDFVDLVARLGPPPHLVWLTCGNVRKAALKSILLSAVPAALELIRDGQPIVEVSDGQSWL